MNPFDSLLTDSAGSSVAPETLEMLGRKASQMYQQQGVPLNRAIVEAIKNEPALGNEHVKRIVEFANTVTFQEQFQNGTDKNVHFEVADPGVVLRDIKDGGSPAHAGKPLNQPGHDYLRPPAQDGGNQNLDQLLSNQFSTGGGFGGDQMAKVASIEPVADHDRHANSIDDVYDTHLRLVATREKLASTYEEMSHFISSAREDLYQAVQSEVLSPDGAGLGGVLSVMQKVAGELAESLMTPIAERLVQNRIPTEVLNASMSKIAGVVVNPEHPLVAITAGIIKTAEEMIIVEESIDQLDTMISQTDAFLKQAGALATGIKKAVKVRGHVPAGLRQRRSAS